tara:strand:- start:22813 stop:22989 length:177 start_codon:yes stop_codon:yes gene_type:complete
MFTNKNAELLSLSGSIFVPHDVDVGGPFAACSSLSDSTVSHALPDCGLINIDEIASHD